MGNAVRRIIFLALAISDIALVAYWLVGNLRSFVIALPVAARDKILSHSNLTCLNTTSNDLF